MPNVIVYTTPTCPYCVKVKELLASKGVPYAEKDVSRDSAAAMELLRLTNGRNAVPVTTIDGNVVLGYDRARLEHLLSRVNVGRPSVGLSIGDASRLLAKRGGVPVFGALVGRVAPGSPAERAGVMPGDIVVEANLRQIANADDLEQVIAGLTQGSRLVLTILRGAERLSAEVRL